MRGFGSFLLCFGLLSLVVGCGEDKAHLQHVARTNGSSVALSHDERIAIVTNRAAGLVTVLALKPERGLEHMVARTTIIDVGEDSEPWAAVVGADDDTAYVLLRKAQQVVRIDNLRHGPVITADPIQVGSEPTSIAITPTGKMLFVANWADGTISMLRTDPFEFGNDIDANETLARSTLLGDLESRPGLAHPRALAMTDNGDQDDDDEILYATEFFSQPRPERTRELADVDSNRQGLVYAFSVRGGVPLPPMALSPVQDTTFNDSDGKPTSCFPNQLYAAAVHDDRLFVTAMCASPRGPLDRPSADPTNTSNYKTLVHPAVFVIDTKSKEEEPEQGHLLTQVLRDSYAADGDAASIRMPLIPNDISFGRGAHGSSPAYVLALGADAIFRLDYERDGTLTGIGSPHHRYLDPLPEKGYAIGLAVTQRTTPAFALALSDVAQQLSVFDLSSERAVATIAVTAGDSRAEAVGASDENKGRGLFATGLGAWSFMGQAWSSCESCHPGGLSDGIVWYFARGPRRTLSAANTYEKNPADPTNPNRRLLLWGANVDEVHDVEGIVRSVSGGSGAVLWLYPPSGSPPSNACRLVYDGKALPEAGAEDLCKKARATSVLRNGLNSSLASIVDGNFCELPDAQCDHSLSKDWNDVDAFIRSLRVPSAVKGLDKDRVKAGRVVFEKGHCGDCHGGPQWTISTLFYSPGDDANGKAPIFSDGASSAVLPDASAALGRLRQDVYNVKEQFAPLNPAVNAMPPRMDCKPGYKCATYRLPPLIADDANARQLLYGANANDAAKLAGDDQLRCALRDVGTFVSGAGGPQAVVPLGQPAPQEVRQDGSTAAQGSNGFGVPSLLGLSVGAPYFHAGNARTLEELFDAAFAAHHNSVTGLLQQPLVLTEQDLKNLVEFLLSLDEKAALDPAQIPTEMDFCH